MIFTQPFSNIIGLSVIFRVKHQNYRHAELFSQCFCRCETFQKKKIVQQKFPEWLFYSTIFCYFLMKIFYRLSSTNWCLNKYCLWTRFPTKWWEFDVLHRKYHVVLSPKWLPVEVDVFQFFDLTIWSLAGRESSE